MPAMPLVEHLLRPDLTELERMDADFVRFDESVPELDPPRIESAANVEFDS